MKKVSFIFITFYVLVSFNAYSQDEYPKSPADVYCNLEYTVTKLGKTKDIKVLDCGSQENTDKYRESAIEAAKKYEYEPKLVNGEPVDVNGVTIRIGFWFDETKK